MTIKAYLSKYYPSTDLSNLKITYHNSLRLVAFLIFANPFAFLNNHLWSGIRRILPHPKRHIWDDGWQAGTVILLLSEKSYIAGGWCKTTSCVEMKSFKIKVNEWAAVTKELVGCGGGHLGGSGNPCILKQTCKVKTNAFTKSINGSFQLSFTKCQRHRWTDVHITPATFNYKEFRCSCFSFCYTSGYSSACLRVTRKKLISVIEAQTTNVAWIMKSSDIEQLISRQECSCKISVRKVNGDANGRQIKLKPLLCIIPTCKCHFNFSHRAIE